MRWGAAIRDIVIILAAVVIAAVPISYYAGYAGVPFDQVLIRLGLWSALIITVGFAISGAVARQHRWRHGFVVALGLWLTGLINVLFMPRMLLPWLLSSIPAAIFMGIGVSLSYLFVRANSEGLASAVESDADTATPPEQG